MAALATDDLTGGTRVLLALLAVLSIIVGLWAVRHVSLTLLALAVLLGIFWVVNGTIELFTALSHSGMPERGWTIFMGVLSILAGIIGWLPGPDPARPGRDPGDLAGDLRRDGMRARLASSLRALAPAASSGRAGFPASGSPSW